VPRRTAAPDKRSFKIGEVAALLKVKPQVLRFWETEFKAIKPAKTRARQRLYRKSDIDVLRRVKHLLHKERLTIEDAKKRLRAPTSRRRPRADHNAHLRATLDRIKKEIESLHRMLT
jgi:DNA-binding transcriptional MerR regulator